MIRSILIAGLLAGSVSAPLQAQDPKAVVGHRQNIIGSAGRAAVALNNIAKGDLNQEDHIADIARLMAVAAAQAKAAFETDTRGADVKTDAKDLVWQDWDDFAERMDAYVVDAQKIADLAEAGQPDEMISTLRTTFRDHCKGCHDRYRKE